MKDSVLAVDAENRKINKTMSHIDKFGRFSSGKNNCKIAPLHSSHLKKLNISADGKSLDVGLLAISNMSMSPTPQARDCVNIEHFETRLKIFEHLFLRAIESRFVQKKDFADFQDRFLRATDSRYQLKTNKN